MKAINIEPGKATLGVIFDPVSHTLEFSGSSYPSNPVVFFEPLVNWIKAYLAQENGQLITLVFKLKYFNTSSSHFLFKILELFSDPGNNAQKYKIVYYHENGDDDSLDSWRSLIYDLDLKYKIITFDNHADNTHIKL